MARLGRRDPQGVTKALQTFGGQPFTGTFARSVQTLLIPASAPAGTTFRVTCYDPTNGETFAPVAIMAHYSGRSTTGQGFATSNWGHGLATGTSSRRCTASRSVHTAADMDCHGGGRDDAFIAQIDSSSFVGLVDIDAFLDDGYRLIIDDQLSSDLLVVLEAWGGDLQATLTTIELPNATGTQDHNLGLDLDTGFNDKCVVFVGSASSGGAVGNIRSWTDRHDIGAVAGNTPAQWAMSGNSINGGADSDTYTYFRDGICISWPDGTDGDVDIEAELTDWLSTGVRLNYIKAESGTRFVFALAVLGQRWEAGVGQTQTVTSTPQQISTSYAPKYLLVAGQGRLENTFDTMRAIDNKIVGVAASTSDRAATNYVDYDNAASATVGIGLHTDRIYYNDLTIARMDLVSLDVDGFTVQMESAADDVAYPFGWLIGADEVEEGLSVTTGTIASGNQRFAPTVAAGAVTVVGATIASGSQSFPPSVVQNVTTGTIASTAVLFAPSVLYVAAGAHIASTAQLFAPALVSDQNVTTGTVASTVALFAPSVAHVVTTAHIGSTVAMFAPSLAYAVTTAAISSGSQLFAPSVIADQPVTTGTIASGHVLFAPTVSYVVTTGTIGSGSQLFAPTVTTDTAVTGAHIASTVVMFAPSLAYVVAGATITSTAALFAPTVAAGAVTVVGGTIAAGSTLFPPTVSTFGTVTTGHIATTVVTFAPTVIQEQFVTGAFIASGSALFGATVLADQAITTAFRSSTVALFGPTVLADQAITTGTIPAGSAIFAPSVSRTVAAGTIGSTAQTFAPTLSYGIQLPSIGPGTLYPPTLIPEFLVVIPLIAPGSVLYGPSVFIGVFSDVINLDVYIVPALGLGVAMERAAGLDVTLRTPDVGVYLAPTED